MVPKDCSICISSNREQIDIEIINGTSVRDIAARFKLSRSSVGRHRVNCHKAIVASTLEAARAGELLEAAKQTDNEVTSLSRADEMFRRCRKAAIEAFKRGDLKAGFQGAREARGYLELVAKLRGDLEAQEATRTYQPMFAFPPGTRPPAITVDLPSRQLEAAPNEGIEPEADSLP